MLEHKTKATIALAAGVMILALGGCHKEGPAEKAGKQVDKAVNSAGDQLKAAGDEIQKAVK